MYQFWFFQFIDDKFVTIDLIRISMVDKEQYSFLNDRIQCELCNKRMQWNYCVLDFGLQFKNEELWIRAAREQEKHQKLQLKLINV